MSIYIPGIAPPENCDKCTHPTCTLWQNHEPDGRHEDCPIIEIGTHGRLIDADAFLAQNAYFADREFVNPKYDDTLKDLVDAAQTIIPAEGGADG